MSVLEAGPFAALDVLNCVLHGSSGDPNTVITDGSYRHALGCPAYGELNLTDCTIRGGVYYAWHSKGTMANCDIEGTTGMFGRNNPALPPVENIPDNWQSSGAVCATESAITLVGCHVKALYGSSGLLAYQSVVEMHDSAIGGPTQNQPGGSNGRGFWANDSEITATSSVIDGIAWGSGMRLIRCTAELADCRISRCYDPDFKSEFGGGGINVESSDLALHRCRIIGNRARHAGGIGASDSRLDLFDCVIAGNRGLQFAGGIVVFTNNLQPLHMLNCTVAGNFLEEYFPPYAAGVYVSSQSSAVIANSIVWGNASSSLQGEVAQLSATSATIDHCIVQGWTGGQGGTANSGADPQFYQLPSPGPDGTWTTADDLAGDLRLRPCSPAIDAGNNTARPAAESGTDIAGQPRFTDHPFIADTGLGSAPLVDRGAYEHQPAAGPALCAVDSVLPVSAGGELAVDLLRPLAHADLAIEPRGGQPALRIRLDRPLAAGFVPQPEDVTTSAGSIAELSYDGEYVRCRLQDVPVGQPVDIAFPGLISAQGAACAESIRFTLLPGDVSGDGRVDLADLLRVRALLNQSATVQPRADIQADGLLNIFDLLAVRARLNTSLPTEPSPQ